MDSPHPLTPEVRAAFGKVNAILECSGGEDTAEYRAAWVELEHAIAASEGAQ